MHTSFKYNRKAFTLVELAVVLVVVGLVIAGILAGRELIKSAQLSKQLSEWQSFRTMTETFRIKYKYLPGDLPNASSFMQALPYEPGACCPPFNGNGDKLISNSAGGWFESEKATYFQHLYQSKISNKYTGVFFLQSGNTQLSQIGVNIPNTIMNQRNSVWFAAVADPTNLYNSNGPYIPKGVHYF